MLGSLALYIPRYDLGPIVFNYATTPVMVSMCMQVVSFIMALFMFSSPVNNDQTKSTSSCSAPLID